MPDRVKESIFNILGSYYDCPGLLPPLHVADVFAGSGAMGLEALSRGAATCTFFEQNSDAIRALQRNIESIGVGPSAVIIRGDAWSRAVTRPERGGFDLIFLDPPFRASRDTAKGGPVRRYLAKLSGFTASKGVVVWHHEGGAALGAEPPEPWQVLDERSFGSQVITFLGK